MNRIKISDSDKRLLLIFCAIVIVACSYFFIFSKGMSKAAKIEEQNTADQAKVQQMEQMEAGLPKVKENIQLMVKKQKTIISTYPSAMTTEKAIESLQAYEDNSSDFHITDITFTMNQPLAVDVQTDGTVFPGLATRNIWFGVLMSGLFFSLMHANPVQTVHQFGLGIVLALVVALSGSIWASVIVHFVNNFISLTLTAYLPQVDEIYLKLGYFNWLTGVASVIVGLALLVCLLYLFYRAGNKRQRAGEVSNVYEEDGFTIVATANVTTKSENVFKGMFRFFKSLFTKQGWKRVQYELEERNEVEYLGKNQHMSGVWIALALVCIYWLYAFIVGMV